MSQNRNIRQVKNSRKPRAGFGMSVQKKLVVLFMLILLAFLGLAGKLVYIKEVKGTEYTKNVLSQQQYRSTTLPYKRGDILDSKGTKLAISEKVYNLIIDCKAVLDKEDYLEPTLEALRKCFPELNINETRKYITEHPGNQYYSRKDMKQLTYEEISDFVEIQNNKKENPNVQGVWFEEEFKRMYPNGSLACDVIGFTIKNSEGAGFQGNYGLEAYYNDILNGTNGREYGYLNEDSNLERTTIPATDGYNLITTIDANIQSIVEKYLKKHNEEYANQYRVGNGAQNAGCIVMDIDSGEILAMADYNSYDLNDPYNTEALLGTLLLDENGKVTEEKTVITAENKEEVLADNNIMNKNLNALWKNFCIANTYEPGSTAKAFTIAAGLESGKMTGNEYYNCQGGLKVGNYFIKCHNYSIGGDGMLNVQQSLEQSCNVALMLMGNQIGVDTFLEYQDRFNFGLRTNIDLYGESRTKSLVFNKNNMGPTELATSTFGQGYNVTMIQMISGFCSLINGGYYYEPHVVKKITTADGSLVQEIEPRIIKQTISESTSALIRQYCKGVVDNGTGKTARPAGYSIGGKTGTAEMGSRDKRDYVVSFLAFAPAEDPQIAIYVVVDRPNVGRQDDAKHATRIVRDVLTETLPYLNVFMTEELSEDEIKELEALDLEIIMEANKHDDTLTENEAETENSAETEDGEEQPEITDANGGDITSSVPAGEDEGSTAPLTGVLLDSETGEALNTGENDDSPY